MKARCYNPRATHYSYYGAQGVRVSPRWLDSFANFLEDLGPRPDRSFSLDRIDHTKDYQPGNVRWATRRTQSLNRRRFSNNKSGFRGVSWHKASSRWRVQIANNDLGGFRDKMEAAHVYNQAASQLFGEVVELNKL